MSRLGSNHCPPIGLPLAEPHLAPVPEPWELCRKQTKSVSRGLCPGFLLGHSAQDGQSLLRPGGCELSHLGQAKPQLFPPFSEFPLLGLSTVAQQAQPGGGSVKKAPELTCITERTRQSGGEQRRMGAREFSPLSPEPPLYPKVWKVTYITPQTIQDRPPQLFTQKTERTP